MKTYKLGLSGKDVADKLALLEGDSSLVEIQATKVAVGAATEESDNDLTLVTKGYVDDRACTGCNVYCTCTDWASTANKTVYVASPLNSTFELKTGSKISVRFSYTNEAENPTLNVAGTGAKSIYAYGQQITTGSLNYAGWAPKVVNYFYDGTNWVFDGFVYDVDTDTNTTSSNAAQGYGYGTCDTAEATIAKEAVISSYSLSTGGIIAIKFIYAVPANATLKIKTSSTITGGITKSIYYNGSAITADVIKAGDTATFMYDGTNYNLISIDRVENENTSSNSSIAYGTCSTSSNTAAKVITITSPAIGWELKTGCRISVKFSATNTASNPTFNVNSTGAKNVYYNGSRITTSNLNYAGYLSKVCDYEYDGTNWVYLGRSFDVDTNSTYTNVTLGNVYGTCTTAEATTAKTATISGFTLSTHCRVTIRFTNAVPAGSTLNISSTGAKSIYYKGSAITDGVIKAGAVATFVATYTNSAYQYELIAIDPAASFETFYITSGKLASSTLGNRATAEGFETTASGNNSHAEGWMTTATKECAHSEGNETWATGDCSHSEGHYTSAGGSCTHAEGYNTAATGDYSHTEGYGTSCAGSGTATAMATAAHAEGYQNTAKGDGSHAEGGNSTAHGLYSHAEGYSCDAYGSYSHAEGEDTTANYAAAHAEGYKTVVYSNYSHAEGSECTAGNAAYIVATAAAHAEGEGSKAVSKATHAEGYNSIAGSSDTVGIGAHAEGYNGRATNDGAHAEGYYDNGTSYGATGKGSHSEGYNTKAASTGSHAEGSSTTASHSSAHAEGSNTTASNSGAHAEGCYTTASGVYSHAEGYYTAASGNYTHAEGYYTKATGSYSHAAGHGTSAGLGQYVIGHFNNTRTAGTTPSSQANGVKGDAFIIGNGYGTGGTASASTNAFRVAYSGAVYAAGTATYSSTNADYAEYFEWVDANTGNEDRRGYFVTMDGEKIKLAAPGDYVLGIVSGAPSVAGNNPEDWGGRFIYDEFGTIQEEEFEYEEQIYEEVFNEETQETELVSKSVTMTGVRFKENPDYNPELAYIQREDRPEWDAVGMLGVLSVRDNGTCQVNGYCTVAEGGIATASETGYRVIKRVNDHIVKVVFR